MTYIEKYENIELYYKGKCAGATTTAISPTTGTTVTTVTTGTTRTTGTTL